MSAAIREDDVEQAMLVWLLGLGSRASLDT